MESSIASDKRMIEQLSVKRQGLTRPGQNLSAAKNQPSAPNSLHRVVRAFQRKRLLNRRTGDSGGVDRGHVSEDVRGGRQDGKCERSARSFSQT